ncbi:MAG: zinc ribbon domain-containing protein [Nitrososphaeria archaeon]
MSPQTITISPTFPTPTFTLMPWYAISVKPTNITIEQGSNKQVVVTVSSYFGYNKTVSLFSTTPTGITISFALSKLTPPVNGNISTTAFINVEKTVAAGVYTAFINGTDGTAKNYANLSIKVTALTTTTTTPTTTSTTTSTTTIITTTTLPTSTTTSPSSTITTPTTTINTTSTTTTTLSGESDMTLVVVIVVIVIITVIAIAFFLMRKKPPTPPPKRFCMHCGSSMAENALSCPKCGKQPAGGPDTKTCPNCGAVINILASFCPKCGAAQPKESDKGGAASS